MADAGDNGAKNSDQKSLLTDIEAAHVACSSSPLLTPFQLYILKKGLKGRFSSSALDNLQLWLDPLHKPRFRKRRQDDSYYRHGISEFWALPSCSCLPLVFAHKY